MFTNKFMPKQRQPMADRSINWKIFTPFGQYLCCNDIHETSPQYSNNGQIHQMKFDHMTNFTLWQLSYNGFWMYLVGINTIFIIWHNCLHVCRYLQLMICNSKISCFARLAEASGFNHSSKVHKSLDMKTNKYHWH